MTRENHKHIFLSIFWDLLLFLPFILLWPYASISAQNSKDSRNISDSSDKPGNLVGENLAGMLESSSVKKFFLDSTADWDKKIINIEISVPIDKLELQTRYYVNGIIESNFSIWLYDAVKNLQINSQQTLQDFWGSESFKNPYTFLKFMLKKKYAVFYPNLQSFRAAYELSLYPDLVQIWINEQFRNEELPPAILNKNATEFTGLIIYVENKLPVRGEPYNITNLMPALFPRIYDNNLKLVISYRNVKKNVLLERGMLSYDIEPNADKHQYLVGNLPLRIVAQELFGKARTDLIIGDSDSLLENAYMREALRHGRILVLYESAPSNVLYVEDK